VVNRSDLDGSGRWSIDIYSSVGSCIIRYGNVNWRSDLDGFDIWCACVDNHMGSVTCLMSNCVGCSACYYIEVI
jgi:hypothetical protein